MGTDIHGVFQKWDGKRWVDIPSKYQGHRHYQLFAVLAGVRNGVGFAGCPTGEAIKPIAEPRGYPEGFAVQDDMHPVDNVDKMTAWRRECHEKYEKDKPLEIFMGDHSHSWLTGEEMLKWFKKAPVVTKVGIIDRAEYAKWNGKGEPASYCGGVGGPGVLIVDDTRASMKAQPDWTYVSVTWKQSLRKELAYFFDEVQRLQKEHGKVRFVFGFDS